MRHPGQIKPIQSTHSSPCLSSTPTTLTWIISGEFLVDALDPPSTILTWILSSEFRVVLVSLSVLIVRFVIWHWHTLSPAYLEAWVLLRLHTRLDTSGEFLLCSRRFWIHRAIDIDSSDVVAHLHWYVSTNLRCHSGCCTKSTPVYVLATTSPQPQSPDYIWLTPWIHLRPYSPGFYPASSWWHWRPYRLDVLKLGYSCDCILPWIYPASHCACAVGINTLDIIAHLHWFTVCFDQP